MEADALEIIVLEKLSQAKRRITSLKTQLYDGRFALEKLARESSKKEADFWAQVVFVEEALNVELVRVEHLERDLASKA